MLSDVKKTVTQQFFTANLKTICLNIIEVREVRSANSLILLEHFDINVEASPNINRRYHRTIPLVHGNTVQHAVPFEAGVTTHSGRVPFNHFMTASTSFIASEVTHCDTILRSDMKSLSIIWCFELLLKIADIMIFRQQRIHFIV